MNPEPRSDRIAVIGAGAIGGVTAAVLSRQGHDVTLCVRRPIERLTVEMNGNVQDVPVRIVNDPSTQTPVDWVLLATKVQDTVGASPWLLTLVGPKTVVAVLQNGIDQVERVQPLLKQGQLLPSIVYTSAEVVGPGHVRHHTGQKIVVPQGPLGIAFARLFEGSTMHVEPIEDFLTANWRKLFGNIAVSPITALTMRRIGIMRDEEIRHFAAELLKEAVAVGCASGAKLQFSEVAETLNFYAGYNPSGGSSMLYDRIAGRPMEHEHLTGALVHSAQKLGIEVPFNRMVLALLRALDGGRSESA